MPDSKPATPRLRWNSIFVKLAAPIFVSALVLTGISSLSYMRTAMSQLDAQVAHSARQVNGMLAELLSGAVLSRAPGPIERQLGTLTQVQDAEVRHGLAMDAAGMVIAAAGAHTGDEAALQRLAAEAMAAGERRQDETGMMIADPVVNRMSGTVAGAFATSWTSAPLTGEVMAAQMQAIALAMAIVVSGVVVLVYGIRRWITRPMIRIAHAIGNLAGGNLAIDIAERARGDEIGDIGKALATLQGQLVANREEERENRFRGTAFASSTAAVMMVDAEMRITSVNRAVCNILSHYAEDFRKVVPDFDPQDVVGREMDLFHKGALRERVRVILLDPAKLPYQVNIGVGDARFTLTINRVDDAGGALEGFVVEWTDITTQFMQNAILHAIDANQVKAEFGLDGGLLHGNDHFANMLGTSVSGLAGRSHEDIFRFDAALSLERGAVFDRLNRGESVYGSFRVARVDGSEGVIDGSFTPVLDAAGRLLRIILIGSDMTEAKRSLQQAEADRARLLAAQASVVDALRAGLERLAAGDLTGRIEEAFPQDYDQLRADFNRAADRLQEAMRGVIENADLIQGEAAEISSAADDLSARTERQAATLEQTAAALDQLTSSVSSAAEGAAHANGLVETARENAEASGEVVRQAVAAMGEIETSSQQISKITGVIDDIAFQTNLLALNAGVEAARAGEAGRGFAVVASEVRALAQRSSEAAREINSLISSSGHQVKRGVALVGQAGEALKGIVDSVKEISRNVNEIAVSSREQSVGLGEINAAVNQLDQVTQQNAAMFEETTAASHALTREAETLARTMGRFQIGERLTAAAPVVAAPFASKRPAMAVPTQAVASGTAAGKTFAASVPDFGDDDGWDEF